MPGTALVAMAQLHRRWVQPRDSESKCIQSRMGEIICTAAISLSENRQAVHSELALARESATNSCVDSKAGKGAGKLYSRNERRFRSLLMEAVGVWELEVDCLDVDIFTLLVGECISLSLAGLEV